MDDFKDKNVVVTGGGGALGDAVVRMLVERGATVYVPMFPPKELDRFQFRDDPRVHARAGLDFTIEKTVEKYYAELPSLYASIHLAGGFSMSNIADTSLTAFLELMNLNAVTCFLACREAVNAIRRSGKSGGRIVNVAAKPVLFPTGGMAAYAASKAVVASLTRSLAEELAPEGIWVNAVAPSIMNTKPNREAMPKADHASWPSVDDVASEIVHLASKENRVARGAIVPVFGRT